LRRDSGCGLGRDSITKSSSAGAWFAAGYAQRNESTGREPCTTDDSGKADIAAKVLDST